MRELKKAETVDGALAPALTRWDLRVLRAVPTVREDFNETQPMVSAWQVAERLATEDVAHVRLTLTGLGHRHLVHHLGIGPMKWRWYRTREGDEKVDEKT